MASDPTPPSATPQPPEVRIHSDADEALDAAARFVAERLAAAVAERGTATIALAGGSTPRALYTRLAEPHLAASATWQSVHVLWGDERCVPADDPASNQHLAREALLERVPIQSDHVHPIDGSRPARAAAEDFAAELERLRPGGAPLDIVLLGMGDDGHTASLFPGGSGLAPGDPPVVATRSPVPPHERVSLALHALAHARDVVFLVLGAEKAARLAAVRAELARDPAEATMPAARLRPGTSGHTPHHVTWFVDRAAAGGGDPR